MQLYLKHLLIGTPLERPLTRLRPLLEYRFRKSHPELAEIFAEPDRIEDVVQRLVKPSSNCVDVGGHLGSMLNLFLTLAPQGKHVAFEAVPRKAEWLKRKFAKADVKAMALGDEPGSITFYENLSRPGYSSMRPPTDSRDQFREVVIPCERLDSVIPTDHKVDFLKVDVEGAELMVLRGAEKLLDAQHPPILFECTTTGAKEFGSTPVDVFDLLTTRHNYGVYYLKRFLENGAPLDRETFQRAVVYPFQAFNFLAVAAG